MTPEQRELLLQQFAGGKSEAFLPRMLTSRRFTTTGNGDASSSMQEHPQVGLKALFESFKHSYVGKIFIES